MLGDRHQRHELAGIDRGHLRPVVRPGDQDRALAIGADRQPVSAEQPLVLERPREQQLRLSVSLLACEQVADPVPSDDVDDRVSNPLAPGEVGVGVRPRRGAGFSAGPFPRSALRTGRARLHASGSPQVHAALLAHGVGIRLPR
jgi:hypothetical protein